MPDWNKLRGDFLITKKYAPIPIPVCNEVSKFCQGVLNHGLTLWDNGKQKWKRQWLCMLNLSELVIGKR